MEREYMLTTIDNPFSPVTHYDSWLTWDLANYNSNSLLARVAYTSPELSDTDQRLAIQEAIDLIVRENVSGVHTKVEVPLTQIAAVESESSNDPEDLAA